eukprot:gene16617-18307_t
MIVVLQLCLLSMIKADGLGDLGKILAALGGDSECSFKCPRGQKPLANPKHTPTSNGCGSMGLQLDTSDMPGMRECCDVHDKCYDTCNNYKIQCDEEFRSCLSNVCLFDGLSNRKSKAKMKECQGSADMMYATTSSLGCAAYMESQRNACLCGGRQLTKRQMKEANEGPRIEL